MVTRMIRFLGLALAVAVVVFGLPTASYAAAVASNQDLPGGALSTGWPRLGPNDMFFIRQAARSGKAEIELSQLALQKAQDAQVRAFAERMVTDHTQQAQQLQALAGSKGVGVAPFLDAEHRVILSVLSRLSGAQFDMMYMKTMVTDHQTSVALFEWEAANGGDPDVRAFAESSLPALREHLNMAIQIYGSLQSSTPQP